MGHALSRWGILSFGFLLLAGCYPDNPPAAPETVSDFLVGLLHDQDPEVRRTAAEAIGKIGSPSHPPELIHALSDPDDHVREAAAIALGRLEARPDAARQLAQALSDPSDAVRRAAARSLGEQEPSATPPDLLLRLLKHRDPAKRRAAAQAMLNLEVPADMQQLSAAVMDPDADVRQGIIAALAESGVPEAVPILRQRLRHDPVPGVRAEAAYRLGKIGTVDLVAELKEVALADSDPGVQRWALWASGQLMPPPDSDSGR